MSSHRHTEVNSCRLSWRKWCNCVVCDVKAKACVCDLMEKPHPPPPQTSFDPSPAHSALRLLLHRPSSNGFLKLNLKKKKQAYFEFCSFSIKVLNQVFFRPFVQFFLEYVSCLLPNCGLHTYSIFVPPRLHFSVVCNGYQTQIVCCRIAAFWSAAWSDCNPFRVSCYTRFRSVHGSKQAAYSVQRFKIVDNTNHIQRRSVRETCLNVFWMFSAISSLT